MVTNRRSLKSHRQLRLVFLAPLLRSLLLALEKLLLCSVSLDLSQRASAKAITLDLVHSSTLVTELKKQYSPTTHRLLLRDLELSSMVSSPIMRPQLMISVLLAVHICHLLLIMVIWLLFLVKRIHSVCLELLVETLVTNRRSLNSLVDLCLVLVVLLRLLYGRPLKRPSSSEHQVAQLRNMLRIMLALATLRSRKRHLSLLILTSDSVLIGELVILKELQEFLVMLMQHSRVHMYLRVYSLECTPMIRVMSGVDIVHHLVMSTPSTARSAVLHSSTATVELARSMFMVTMVTTEILELLVHCSELVVERKLPA